MDIETGKRLYEYRRANGLSQEELAEKMQVSHQTISKWERAESSPNTDNLIALAKLYGVTIDELINGKEEPNKAKTTDDNQNYQTQQNDISFKNGIHIHNGTDNVDIGWNGIHVESKNGDEVHIGGNGVHVDGSGQKHMDNTPPKNPWLHALLPTFAVLFYLLVGFTTDRGWALGWIIFLLIPIIETAVNAFKTKNPSVFAYPVFITALYLTVGMLFSLWHPTWILFITIPIYYILCDAYKKSQKSKEDDFLQYTSASTTTYYSPNNVPPVEKNAKHNNITAIIISVICAITIIIIVPVICVFGFINSDSFENIISNGINSISGIVSNGSVFEYKNDSLYSVGSAEIPAENINDISVDWVNGNIDIEYYSGNTISFSEASQSNEDYSLRYLVKDNELKIKYCKSGKKSSGISNKNLTIKIPQNVSLETVDICNVSSNVTVNGIIANNAVFETVSGNINANGSFSEVSACGVSGDLYIMDNISPESVDFSSVSGDTVLFLPADIKGFSVDYDTVSGDIKSDFNLTGNGITMSGNRQGEKAYGDGSTEIDFESVSGNFEISKSAA